MIEHCSSDLAPGQFVQTAEELLAQDYAAINKAMIQILENLLAVMSLKTFRK